MPRTYSESNNTSVDATTNQIDTQVGSAQLVRDILKNGDLIFHIHYYL
jgi:hypothetical protein